MRIRIISKVLVIFLTLSFIISWQKAYARTQSADNNIYQRIRSTESVSLTVLPESNDTSDILPTTVLDIYSIQPTTKSTLLNPDSTLIAYADSIQRSVDDTLELNHFNNWTPDPIRAMWLAMVVPGGGQMYNRKYWKLPIVYGGVVGCIYAVSWNAQMLRDYSQAYQDIMDSDPTTNSHIEMLPLGYDITGREEHFKSVFKRKKNFYRRNRDLSIFCIAGVYLLSIIDAYVDAELSTFDIGSDLSLSISPQMLPSGSVYGGNPKTSSPGITFNLTY